MKRVRRARDQETARLLRQAFEASPYDSLQEAYDQLDEPPFGYAAFCHHHAGLSDIKPGWLRTVYAPLYGVPVHVLMGDSPDPCATCPLTGLSDEHRSALMVVIAGMRGDSQS